jgi:sugar phosphate isomerase/epimerase
VIDRSAHDLDSGDIVLGHFTLGRTYPLDARLEAAEASGVAGVGLFMADLERHAAAGLSDADLQRKLEARGLLFVDLDLITLAPRDEPMVERAERFTRRAVELADRFGYRYLQAIGPVAEPGAAGFDEIVDALGRVADAVEPFGVEVGLEYVGFTTVTTAAEAVAIATATGRSNVGVCIDVWHHRRGPAQPDLASSVPAELVRCVQLNDGPVVPEDPDYKTDCVRNRWPPGAGEMDVAGFVAEIRAMDVDVPWTVEVCRGEDTLAGDAGRQHVLRSVAATRAVLGFG